MKKSVTYKICLAAMCLAIAMVLPFLTGQIPQIGKALSPMHIPVFLCGFICGWPWGMLVGFISPLLRSVLFSMPAMGPNAFAMAFELMTYGFLSGMLYHLFPKKIPYIYITLILSMIGGRLVWGLASFIILGITGAGFTFQAFLAGALINAVPGIILHLVLIPIIVIGLKKARLLAN